MKTCKHCGQTKPIDQFRKRKDCREGVCAVCKRQHVRGEILFACDVFAQLTPAQVKALESGNINEIKRANAAAGRQHG